jgi:KTSC domain
MPMKYAGVSSSAIAAMAYDAPRRVMGVIFSSGDEYFYYDVSYETFEAVQGAPSIGMAFDSLIKKAGVKYERIR